jgi:endonuclease YncB( thermonuclease family)
MYSYKGIVRSVTDGDTIRVDIDLGLDSWKHNVPLRLADINAPEVKGEEKPEGDAAKAFLQELLPVGKKVFIDTDKDKGAGFGRYKAWVYLGDIDDEGFSVNQQLVMAGHAVWKDYD